MDDGDLAFLAKHRSTVLVLIARFAPLTPALLARHRARLNKDHLAQNVHREHAPPEPSFPTEDPGLSDAWRRFEATTSIAPGDARVEAFLEAERSRLEAGYVSGYRMQGRDWGAEESAGWSFLAAVPGIPWTVPLLARFEDRLDFAALSRSESVAWSEALLERFAARWDWDALARNPGLPWSEALLTRFPKVTFRALSSNPGFPWTRAFLAANAAAFDWRALARNRGIRWTAELVAAFADRLPVQSLLENPTFDGREALLAARADEVDWDDLARSPFFQWTAELLERFAERIPWSTLSANELVPWSRALLERHDEFFDGKALARNGGVWRGVFEPLLRDEAALDAWLSRA